MRKTENELAHAREHFFGDLPIVVEDRFDWQPIHTPMLTGSADWLLPIEAEQMRAGPDKFAPLTFSGKRHSFCA